MSQEPVHQPEEVVTNSWNLRSLLHNAPVRGIVALAGIAYFLSAFIHFPSSTDEIQAGPHLALGRMVIAPPRVLSGDSPHYLAAVSSLIEDGDFDLSNNYTQAIKGEFDLGSRFRGERIDHHTERDSRGYERSTHSPFFPLLLSILVWPLRGSAWVEPACIWLTLTVSLIALKLFSTLPWLTRTSQTRTGLALLAFATPLWCYSRDLWSAPWIMLIWLGLLIAEHSILLAALAFLGSTIKYPFFVVPITLAAIALYRGSYVRATALLAGSLTGVAAVIALIQYLFRDVDHFSWFHSGIHAGFGLPLDGIVGLLLHPHSGILVFSPFLLWGLSQFRRLDEVYLPSIAYFLVHASYDDWMGGTGFSARYLVPVLPIMVLAVCKSNPRSRLYFLAVGWSVFWAVMGGLFPALVYDRSPWGALHHVWVEATRGTGYL